MKVGLSPLLFTSWCCHIVLWLVWPYYKYGFGIAMPAVVIDEVSAIFRYRQIEDLPDAQAFAVLAAGFVIWAAIAAALASIATKTRRR